MGKKKYKKDKTGKTKMNVVALSADIYDDEADRALVVARERNDLDDNDIRYIRRRMQKLARNLRRKYEFLGAGLREARMVDHSLNLIERTVTIRFLRNSGTRWQTEAVLQADIELKKPMTRKILASLGLLKDPETSERMVVLNGRISRPTKAIAHVIPVNDFRIRTVPSAGTQVFNTLIESGFLYHPRSRNYLPIHDEDAVMEPLGRRERRAAEKLPIVEMNAEQRRFVREEISELRLNFKRRYGPLFDAMRFDVDPVERTFSVRLTVSDAFAGAHGREILLQGTANLFWRNKGDTGTRLELRVTGGLSREFQKAVDTMDPLVVVRKKRGRAAENLFNMLAMSGKISLQDADEAREARKDLRTFKPTRVERRAYHRSDRRANNVRTAALRLVGS